MSYYIYAEDYCSAIIGPFASYEDAQAHIDFCRARADAAEMKIINEQTAKTITAHLTMTPEEDRNFEMPA